MSVSSAASPVRVAIVNDYEVVVAGVARMLAEHAAHVEVVELDNGLPVLNQVDVVLWDTFGKVAEDVTCLRDLVRAGNAKIVVYTWNHHPDAVDAALSQGAAGYLSKGLTAHELVAALQAIHDGETVIGPRTSDSTASGEVVGNGLADWPGREAGLTPREAEMLAFIAQGLSNQEIADASFLSINTVKTYIRAAYSRIGVTRRSQAVAWAMRNGFALEAHREIAHRSVDVAGRVRPEHGTDT